MHLKISSAEWRQICLGVSVLTKWIVDTSDVGAKPYFYSKFEMEIQNSKPDQKCCFNMKLCESAFMVYTPKYRRKTCS